MDPILIPTKPNICNNERRLRYTSCCENKQVPFLRKERAKVLAFSNSLWCGKDAAHACIGNSFHFLQAAPWHAEAIVQWRIVVVFKQQKNLWLTPVAPGLLSIIVAVLRGQQPPRFISLFPGARTIQSPAGGGCVCEITQVASVAAATWYKPTIQLRSAL